MPKYPSTPAARALFVLGLSALLLALWLQLPMWQAVFGFRPVAPGGGEYMIALFFGLPGLLLSMLLLGIATARAAWRSKAAAIALILAFGVLLGWLALFLRSLFV
ncbi:MAG: hypothetical protein KF804_05365 [Burkholderiales bacterium]|jgi:hypothetical protein|nr:hypothetical protein [Burkholderiales bacterium]